MERALRRSAEELKEQLVAWRRHLHAQPERSGQEEQTARYVAEELRAMGYEPQERIGGTYGLAARIAVKSTPAIALRADMDALPITEENEVEYASRNPGVMHACGHDGHTAMLLGAARLLMARKNELRRSVRLIFQPSEELDPGGAKPMIEAGILKGVERVFGLHLWSEMPTGTLGTRVGPFMASPDHLELRIIGRGGHAAMPQQCVDPVVVAAHVVLALQTVVSRSISMADSAIVSVTKVQAGTAGNVIPECVEMQGTIRTLDEAVRAQVHVRVRALAEGVAAAHGGSAEVHIRRGYPALVNERETVRRALDVARGLGFSEGDLHTLPPQGGGEDFAYYAQERPAAFLFLGARNEAKGCMFPHHHPRFNIDEDALPLGAALLAALALSAE